MNGVMMSDFYEFGFMMRSSNSSNHDAEDVAFRFFFYR